MTRFVYFDLGNVLLDFSHQQAAEQAAHLSGIPAEVAYRVLFEEGLQWPYETGKVSSQQIHQQFCEITQSTSLLAPWLQAISDIFQPKHDVWQIVQKVQDSGLPLGILSNTCDAHWQFCQKEYPGLLSRFGVHALSFRMGAMKPHRQIYDLAAELAQTPLAEILFIDDRPENVAGAQVCGMDAIHFTTPENLAQALISRGIIS